MDFAIPLIFLAILVPALRDRPSWLAAITGGGLALALRGVPANGGLMIGALTGIVVGALTERLLERPGGADAAHGDDDADGAAATDGAERPGGGA